MSKITTIITFILATLLALNIGGTIPLLGTSISAILIGSFIRHTPLYDKLNKQVIKFISSYLLKTGIVLLGFTLSLRILSQVGWQVLIILALVIFVSIGMSLIINQGLKMKPHLSLLIGIGTAICGGSAIMATAPILDAEDDDIAVSVTTMFIYSMLALLFLPIIGRLLGFTDQQFGILAGAAVNDTASVVATSFAWSDLAGSIATVVKLTRTLFLVPVTFGLIYYRYRQQVGSNKQLRFTWQGIKKTIPLFVIFFVLAVTFASIVSLPEAITSIFSQASKFLMTVALVSIGLGVHVKQIKKAGFKPIILGGGCWLAIVSLVVLLIQFFY